MSENIYSMIGTVVVWLFGAGIGVGGFAFAYVLFDSWILRPRRDAIFNAGKMETAQHILRNCYWFSEHPPTMNLMREIVKVYSEGQGSSIDHIRDQWRNEMEQHDRLN